MKKITILLGAILFLGLGSATLSAQKFGHLNSMTLIAELPEIQAANATLEVYQTQLEAQGKVMVERLEKDYNAYMADINSGNLSQVEIAKAEGDLQLQQQSLQQYEYDAQQKVVNKRTELYKPILDKVKQILEEIGKEQGYTMIFDTSQGSLLHVEDSNDVTALVKQKLGM